MTGLRQALEACRARTLWLFDQVPDEFLRVRVHGFYSPIGWHFGHIARTEEHWIQREAMKRPCHDGSLDFIFADLPDNPKDNRVNIPDRAGITAYLGETRKRTFEALETADLTSNDPLLADGYAFHFALQHECQHQETIAEMLQLIQRHLPQQAPEAVPVWAPGVEQGMIAVPSGEFCMGSDEPHGYDNERQSHPVKVEEFSLCRYPVTAYQWTEFMIDGGYSRRELWTDRGWAWKETGAADCPEYWDRRGDHWAIFSPQGLRAIDPDEPVSSVSWFEALAFAKWSGKRLPTEVEWEYAAAYDPHLRQSRHFPWGSELPSAGRAQFGIDSWSAGPVGRHGFGASSFGIENMAGSVWEWTSSPFLPYPGFTAFPYDGYSKDHMDGRHFVCRGGSWATAAPILRCTFRNWYVPGYRQGFLGLRLAQ